MKWLLVSEVDKTVSTEITERGSSEARYQQVLSEIQSLQEEYQEEQETLSILKRVTVKEPQYYWSEGIISEPVLDFIVVTTPSRK